MNIKDYLRCSIRGFLGVLGIQEQFERVNRRLDQIERPLAGTDQAEQLLLAIKYRELREKGMILDFGDVEFRKYSQNGEDGILWYVFSLIGAVTKTCVEICAGNGIQCNCANLIINHGWTGLLVDGDKNLVNAGQEFYKTHPDTFIYPPKFAHAWVAAENVNDLVKSNGFCGEVDLLSLDIDGIDYWVWEALEVISPRVVIAETQAIWGSDASVTVPYRPDFKGELVDGFGVYSGASLPAFVKLAKKKGYRLVGCQRYGFNAVFIRNDIGGDIFPELSCERCFSHPFAKWAHDMLLPRVAHRVWQKV